MAVRQWTNEEWEEFEKKAGVEYKKIDHSLEKFNKVIEQTLGQEKHPEWFESPCECDLCQSYGD